jgi:RNA polymerase sigma-70 factor (ECF subfamily)
MTPEPLDVLFEKLCQGDLVAVEQLFTAYEPLLRTVVRRQLPRRLQAKFDSVDVVQSVWAELFDGFRAGSWQFASSAQLQAFLVTVVRRRLTDRFRHFRHSLEHEQPLTVRPEDVPASHQPRPSEIAQADDLWAKMLALCPPAHHELLRLKRQGLALAEIAARTGLHEGSIRRILRQLGRQLAMGQERPPVSPDEEAQRRAE